MVRTCETRPELLNPDTVKVVGMTAVHSMILWNLVCRCYTSAYWERSRSWCNASRFYTFSYQKQGHDKVGIRIIPRSIRGMSKFSFTFAQKEE